MIFTAYGETYIKLYDECRTMIGTDTGHKPVFEATFDNINEMIDSTPDDWRDTGDSAGTRGADFDDGFTYDDVCDKEVILCQVYGIDCNDLEPGTYPSEIDFEINLVDTAVDPDDGDDGRYYFQNPNIDMSKEEFIRIMFQAATSNE